MSFSEANALFRALTSRAFLSQIGGVLTPPEYSLPTNRLRETAVGERPQERLEKLGAAALSDTELLAMLLRSGG